MPKLSAYQTAFAAMPTWLVGSVDTNSTGSVGVDAGRLRFNLPNGWNGRATMQAPHAVVDFTDDPWTLDIRDWTELNKDGRALVIGVTAPAGGVSAFVIMQSGTIERVRMTTGSWSSSNGTQIAAANNRTPLVVAGSGYTHVRLRYDSATGAFTADFAKTFGTWEAPTTLTVPVEHRALFAECRPFAFFDCVAAGPTTNRVLFLDDWNVAPGGTPAPTPILPPTPTAIAPVVGRPTGTRVQVTVPSSTGLTRVRFGGVTGTGFSIVDATRVEADTAAAVDGPVQVGTATDWSANGPAFDVVAPATDLRFLQPFGSWPIGEAFDLEVEAFDAVSGLRDILFTDTVSIPGSVTLPTGYTLASGPASVAAVAGVATFVGAVITSAGAPTPTLASLTLDPASYASTADGGTRLFTLAGQMSDASPAPADLLATATWAIAPGGVGTLAGSGATRTLTEVAAGTATITATIGGVSGMAAVSLTAPAVRTLASVTVDPPTISGLADQGTVTVTITGMMSDGVPATAAELIAAGYTLTSSDPAVAEVLP